MIANSRRALYKRFRLQGMSGVSAAVKAGYSLSTARCGRLHRAVGLELEKALEVRGLSNFTIADALIDGLKATKENGEKDYNVSHKYIETILKVRGDLTQTSNNIDKMQVNVYIPALPDPKVT